MLGDFIIQVMCNTKSLTGSVLECARCVVQLALPTTTLFDVVSAPKNLATRHQLAALKETIATVSVVIFSRDCYDRCNKISKYGLFKHEKHFRVGDW